MLRVCVLNLKRRRDRRDRFEKLNQQKGLHFIWVEAVDGRELLQKHSDLSKLADSQHRQHSTAGHIGCALSHKLLWHEAVERNVTLLVCEDDAILCSDFGDAFLRVHQQLPPDWDFLLLGYNFDSVLDVKLLPGIDIRGTFSTRALSEQAILAFKSGLATPAVLPLNNAFGFTTYAISPKGARQLLELCFPLTGMAVAVPALGKVIRPASTLDMVANAYYRALRAFCTVPPLAIVPNNDSDTSTSKNQGR